MSQHTTGSPIASRLFDSDELAERERYVIVVPSDHRLARQESVRMSELNGEPFVMLPAGSDVRERFIDLCYAADFVPDISQIAPDSWTVMARSAISARSIRSMARHRISPKAWMKMPYWLAPMVGRPVSSSGIL